MYSADSFNIHSLTQEHTSTQTILIRDTYGLFTDNISYFLPPDNEIWVAFSGLFIFLSFVVQGA